MPGVSDRVSNPASGSYDYNYWKKAFRSQLQELEYDIEEIEGDIPQDLSGTLFRSYPGRFERGGQEYGHYLDGDGCVMRIAISNGEASFKNAFVRTYEFLEEERTESVKFRSTFNTQRPSNLLAGKLCLNNAFDLKLKNLANTNVIYWGDKLLTLFEAGIPYRIDPANLETLGTDGMGIGAKQGLPLSIEGFEIFDSLFGTFVTAHPKIDMHKGRLISFESRGLLPKDRKSPTDTHSSLTFHEWNNDWKLLSSRRHILRNTSSAPHDFSVTENYYVVIENRIGGDNMPYIMGVSCPAKCVDIMNHAPMNLHLIARREGEKSIEIPLTPGFTIHSVNAFERNGLLELYTSAWKSETVASGQVKGGLLGSWAGTAPLFDNIPLTLLYRTVVDLKNEQLIEHAPVRGMESVVIEHPHIHPEVEGRPMRYMYMSLGSVEGLSSPPLGYMRLDTHTGEQSRWFAPLHTYCEEVVIVPKSGNIGFQEDRVWLLAMMFDAELDRSCLGIFDGEDISKGPVSRLWLKTHLPHSLHGSFVPKLF